MRKILLIISALIMLLSTACNNSAADDRSGSTPQVNESKTQISDLSLPESESDIQTPPEITGNEPTSEPPTEQNSTTSQSTAENEPAVSGNSSADTSLSNSGNDQKSETRSEASVPNSEKKPESSAPNSESTPDASSVPPDETTGSQEGSSSVPEKIQEPESPANKEENDLKIQIKIGKQTFSATLYDNETAKAFQKLLPLTLDMSELNGNEKFYYLADSLPTNSSCPARIRTGDIMLYGSDCLVIFYESFSTPYSYTPIGRIDDPNGLAAALGSGNVQVAFN